MSSKSMMTEVSSMPLKIWAGLGTWFYVLGNLSVNVFSKSLRVDTRCVLKRRSQNLNSNKTVPSKGRE